MMQSNGCSTDCSQNQCAENYRIIRAYHDTCDEDDITEDIEEAIHDFEEVCEDQGCNTGTPADDAAQTVCRENPLAGVSSCACVANIRGFDIEPYQLVFRRIAAMEWGVQM